MLPLEGLRIVVTRATHQAEALAAPLRQLGAQVLLLPVLAIAPPDDPGPLREAARRAAEYDWIIFTSANAVEAFIAAFPERLPRIAAIGSSTRRAAEQHGFPVSLTPGKYNAESLVEAFGLEPLAGCRILIPSSAIARDLVPSQLSSLGAQVDVVEAYRNIVPSEAADRAAEIFREPFPHWVTFASPSAVNNLIELIGLDRLRNSKLATIGPSTSECVHKHRLTVTTEASPSTMDGLIGAILRHERTKIGF